MKSKKALDGRPVLFLLVCEVSSGLMALTQSYLYRQANEKTA
ncbi:TPA: hypothetical protein ACGMU1_002126 [Streptococcus agalactiae]